MLDWFSGTIGYSSDHIKTNKIIELSPSGEIMWQKDSHMQVEGSYSAKLQIAKQPPTIEMQDIASNQRLMCARLALRLSGNPVKFLQGHNVFGPDVSWLPYVLQDTCRAFPDELAIPDSQAMILPAIHTTRVDITTMISLGSHQLVHDWLRTAETSTRSRHGRTIMDGDTVYWGKHSTRWSLKAYCKYCEMARHPATCANHSDIREYTKGMLRLELTLRSPELKKIKKMNNVIGEPIIWDYMKKIEVGVMKSEVLEHSPNLTADENMTLSMWTTGVDVRVMIPKATFYRRRRRILDELGVDISLPYDRNQARRETFNLEYLKAHEIKQVPADFPGLVYRPKLFA